MRLLGIGRFVIGGSSLIKTRKRHVTTDFLTNEEPQPIYGPVHKKRVVVITYIILFQIGATFANCQE